MLHNRYYEEYESDFQYELRKAANKHSYYDIAVFPDGEYYYYPNDIPSYLGDDYFVLTVHVDATEFNIQAMIRRNLSIGSNPF
jgi:hypothetical protein